MQENDNQNLSENQASQEQVQNQEQVNAQENPLDQAAKKISELENKITDLNESYFNSSSDFDMRQYNLFNGSFNLTVG